VDVKQLEEIRLFSGVSRKELDRVAKSAIEVDVPEGFRLVHQGHVAYEFFVIQKGTAEVVRDGERIAELGPGDFFGEIALVQDDHWRTASVLATTTMHLLTVSDGACARLLRDNPELAGRLERAARDRLARTPTAW